MAMQTCPLLSLNMAYNNSRLSADQPGMGDEALLEGGKSFFAV